LEAVLGGFTAVVQEWQTAYADQAAQHPHLAPFVAAWQERLETTAQMLAKIGRLAAETALL
jgi:hypothetical protein